MKTARVRINNSMIIEWGSRALGEAENFPTRAGTYDYTQAEILGFIAFIETDLKWVYSDDPVEWRDVIRSAKRQLKNFKNALAEFEVN